MTRLLVDCMQLVFTGIYSICPGRHLAEASVWIVIATILSAFEILPVKDDNGNPIIPKADFHSAITRCVYPFQVPTSGTYISSQSPQTIQVYHPAKVAKDEGTGAKYMISEFVPNYQQILSQLP